MYKLIDVIELLKQFMSDVPHSCHWHETLLVLTDVMLHPQTGEILKYPWRVESLIGAGITI
jgi:hypothetical protein